MAEWIEYTGSEEQIDEIKAAVTGVIFEYVGGIGYDDSPLYYATNAYIINNRINTRSIRKYLICNPHPYKDMIVSFANTGQPVYWRSLKTKEKGRSINPIAFPSGFEYSFTEFEE